MHSERPTRRRFLAGGAVALAGLLAGCTGGDSTPAGDTSTPTADPTPSPTATEAAGDWRTTELRNVLADETFTIASLSGPVVLETFAVWCPVCTRQQEELATLEDADLTRVSLNVDPNEDAARVRSHAEGKGFGWRYAVAPAAMTRSLVDEFGSGITVAPSAPVVVVCEDGSASLLPSSNVKSADTIRSAAGEC